jgi:hypothetical protein
MESQESVGCCNGVSFTVTPMEKGVTICIKCEDSRQAEELKKCVVIRCEKGEPRGEPGKPDCCA